MEASIAFTNFTLLYTKNPLTFDDSGSNIVLHNSKFINMNAFTNVSALAITGPYELKL